MEIGLNSVKMRIIEININTISMIFGQGDLTMSGLEDTFGSGYQQIIIGFVVFILGAFWGGHRSGWKHVCFRCLLASFDHACRRDDHSSRHFFWH